MKGIETDRERYLERRDRGREVYSVREGEKETKIERDIKKS